MKFVAAVALMLVASTCLTGCGGGGGSSAPVVAPPPVTVTPRTDLRFTYYGADGASVSETADHINLVWVWAGDAGTAQLQEAQARGVREAVLDVSYLVYDQSSGTRPSPTAAANLRAYLTQLRNLGLLPMLVAVYPVDEPDMRGLSTDQVTAINGVVRMVLLEFGLNLPLAVIYGDHGQPGVRDYDVLGVDAYGEGAGALRRIDALPADKRKMIIPGGACPWLNDPQPFYDYAQTHLDVWAIVAFVWWDRYDASGQCGIRSAPTRDAYVNVGKRVLSAWRTP
jgi:hypothetical protein